MSPMFIYLCNRVRDDYIAGVFNTNEYCRHMSLVYDLEETNPHVAADHLINSWEVQRQVIIATRKSIDEAYEAYLKENLWNWKPVLNTVIT